MPLLTTIGAASAKGLGFCGASGPAVFVIQSTYDAARSWLANGCCHDSSGNTYTAWTASSLLVVTKHDKAGVLQSQVSLSVDFSGGESFSMKLDSSGNLYIAGTSASKPALMKLASNFSVTFFKTYNPANPYTLSYGNFTAIDIDSSGNVYCVGRGAWQVGQNSQSHGWIYKFDSSGNTTWVREYNQGISHAYYGCALGGDGNLYVAGEIAEYSSSVYKYYLELAKMDTNGNLLTHAKFLGPAYQGFCNVEYGAIYGRQALFNAAGTTLYISGSQRYSNVDQVLGATYDSSLNQVSSFSRSRSNYRVSPGNQGAVLTPTSGFFRTGTFEFNNNNYTSAAIVGAGSTLRAMVNSVSTGKDTYFYGLTFNPVSQTVYQFGGIKNRSGQTNTRGVVFNFVDPDTIPTTEIDSSGITLENTYMYGADGSQTRTAITGASSSMTSTTANGTYSVASTYPTLTTTIY